MHFRQLLKWIPALLVYLPVSAFAVPESGVAQAPEKASYCPIAAELYQEKHIWKAPGGWRSFSTSFTPVAAGFMGAQWKGSNIGTIFCVYSGGDGDFPITIQRGNLTKKPLSGHENWTPKDGYMDCQGTEVTNCPYILRKVKKQTMNQIYQSILALNQ